MSNKKTQIIKDRAALQQPCEPITDINGEGFRIIDTLQQALSASAMHGIGLAANQIGIQKQAFVMQVPTGHYSLGYDFINPVITEQQGVISFGEGCLSFPGEQVETVRFEHITVVDALAPNGRKFSGLAAVCVQHETDHLNGLTMHDRTLDKMKAGPCICGRKLPFSECCLYKLKKGKM